MNAIAKYEEGTPVEKPVCGGSPSACQAKTGEHARHGLRICEYIDSDPRCSCSECDAQVTTSANGLILCYNQHLFTYNEIAIAHGYIVPAGVPYHAR